MSDKSKHENTNRRDFLKLAATGAPAAVAAVAVGSNEAEAATTDTASSALSDTAHTRAYYESTRF
ncbi:formate dehydrogenase region TAT target [Salinihabitans flavidus]|uniref:Formate dehydrogenase region TAT target n=1 Tax=Salinihabitans flavidus TaxID=569882 RepID=A0A1H8PTQ6_9RHOB|nr:ubiquinol-cytochrome c reductase iron-sulfur subunit N-terminal domain-containing protein [Salinihabitans flavidus]SEO44923.1 formate dehydrogenase region TAT target [Salinihabitans flavidus]